MDYWEFFADDALRAGSKLYSRYAQAVRGDATLKEIAGLAKRGQPPANLLFGAAHFLLLRGAQHPLREFYTDLGGTKSADREDPFPLFDDFILSHRSAVEHLVAARVTNTNETGRSALLHAGFRALAERAALPLNLIEIGPSAGLNLIWDQYGVRYARVGGEEIVIAPDAPLVIQCEAKGAIPPPAGPAPKVHRRMGLELNPVDLSNDDDRDWLRALIWPDQVERLQRLDAAIALFAAERPEIRGGDALALLADAIAAMPENETLCIYHTIALYQFSREMRATLEDILAMAGLRRPIWRLAFEFEAPGGAPDADAIAHSYILSLTRYADGTKEVTRLAHAHPHGTWLEWEG